MTVAARVSGVRLLFCDVVGSTALGVELGEAANDELRRELFEALRQPLAAFQGREVKTQGDGLMVSFSSSMSLVLRCAVAMQRSVARLDGADGAPSLSIRIGVSSGEATSEDGDWFGTPVIEAARLCDLAEAGQILVADHALGDLGSRVPPVRSLGPAQLKGFPDPIGCSIVDWEPERGVAVIAPLPPPLDVTGHPDLAGANEVRRRGMAAWQQVLAGGTRVLLVAGPPRAGRTRYAAELVQAATSSADPIVVMYGAAGRADADGSVFAEALRRFVLWAPQPVAAHLAAVDGIARLVPAVNVRLHHDAVHAVALVIHPAELSSVVTAAVRSVSEASPAIIVLDDLQWADADTLDALVDLITSELGRVLVVATFRTTGDDDDAFQRVRDKTDGTAAIETIELGPLQEADVGPIIDQQRDRSAVIPPGTSRLVLDAVGGLAGDVVEAARRLSTLPPGVSDRTVRDVLSVCVPYKGLVPLGTDDAAVFFGRDELVERLSTRLRSQRFVAVTGSSGSGKSSLLQAGVATGFSYAGGHVAVLTPGDDDLMARLRSTADDAGGIVLDQFEQLFTLWSAEHRDALVDELLHLVDYSAVAWVAIGLRSDFYGRCAEHARLAQRLSDTTVLIGRLTEAELRTIIERPAQAASLTLEAGLVDVVLADLASEPSPLPLLSHALYETWRRRRGGILTVADYHEAGGVRRSIARTAERVYGGDFDADGQHTARALFMRLVELGDDAPPTRHPMRLDEIAGMFNNDIAPILEVLVAARLVVVDDDKAELAHEALLTEWPRLVGWLDADRESLRAMAHLARAAHEWEAQGRPESELYRGGRLDAALGLAASGLPLTSVEHAFLDAGSNSRNAEQIGLQRTNRRLRRQLTGVLVALTLAVTAAGVAVVQQRSADRARAVATDQRRVAEVALLSGTARQLADSQVDTAALLAIEANNLAPSGTTLGTLGTVLRSQPTIVGSRYAEFLSEDSTIVARSFDRSTVVFSSGPTLIPVDTTTLEPRPAIEQAEVEASALSPDGGRLASVVDQTLTIASVLTGEITATFAFNKDHPKPLTNGHMTWSDDSHVIVSPAVAGWVSTIDATTGQQERSFLQPTNNLVTAAPSSGAIASVPQQQRFAGGAQMDFYEVASGERTASTSLIEAATSSADAEFSPNGRLLLVGTNAGLELIDTKENVRVKIPNQRSVSSTGTFSADGSRMATIDNAGNIVEYDLRAGVEPIEIARQHIIGATTGFFAADGGDTLFVVVSDHLVQITLDGQQPLATAPMGTPEVYPITVSPRNDQVYVQERRELFRRIYHPQSGEQSPSKLPVGVYPWFFSPSGDWIMTVDDNTNRIVHTMTLDGDEIARGTRVGSTTAITTDAEATLLVTMDDKSTAPVLQRLPSLESVPTPLLLPAVDELMLAASADGQLLARIGRGSDGNQRLDIGNLVTGESLVSREFLSDDSDVTALAFTPDGGEVVLGDAQGGTTSIEISTRERRGERYPSTDSPILWIEFLNGGNLLVALDQQGRLSVWDTTTKSAIWEPLQSNKGQDFDYPLMAGDWEGKWWAITDDAGMRVWNLDVDTWPAIACRARAGRNLTLDEWSRYLPDGEPYHTTCPDFPPGR